MSVPGRVTMIPWPVLAVAAAFESTSFRTAHREYRRVVRGRPTRYGPSSRHRKTPALFAVLLEDSAALRHRPGGDRRDRFRLLP